MSRRFAVLAAGFAAAVSLGGCVSLLPKATPAQLYRFAIQAPAAPARADARGVGLEPIEFPRESFGDGILTTEGSQTSYIAGGRWVGPAPVMFRQAVEQAFDASAPGVRLRARGEPGREVASLGIQVLRFEASYSDPKAPPTIHVTLRARLSAADATPIAVETFDAPAAATANRVSAIVDAYNQAGTGALTALAKWVDTNAPSAGRSARPSR